jgi:hypothetical protein
MSFEGVPCCRRWKDSFKIYKSLRVHFCLNQVLVSYAVSAIVTMFNNHNSAHNNLKNIFFYVATALNRPRLPHYRGFTITLRKATLGRTPLEESSARHRALYLTKHNTDNRKTSMPPAGIEPQSQHARGSRPTP